MSPVKTSAEGMGTLNAHLIAEFEPQPTPDPVADAPNLSLDAFFRSTHGFHFLCNLFQFL
jgi:hypothetical protein